MKILFTLIVFFVIGFVAPDLAQIREDFKLASKNRESAFKLLEKLSVVSKEENMVLVAYKGTVTAITAKYTKENGERKRRFKTGVELLEYAVSQEPNNIEIRCLRLSIQENTPKFLKYKSNLEEDKLFILTNYEETDSKAVKDFVKSYIMQSTGFNTEEKESL